MSAERPPEIKTIPIFPLIRRMTGIRLREGLEMEYALSLIMDTQPQVNLLGINGDRIAPDQIEMAIDGIKAAKQKWEDLRALRISTATPHTENAERDWQK